MTKRKIEYWVIPPDQDAEFVADMENGKHSVNPSSILAILSRVG